MGVDSSQFQQLGGEDQAMLWSLHGTTRVCPSPRQIYGGCLSWCFTACGLPKSIGTKIVSHITATTKLNSEVVHLQMHMSCDPLPLPSTDPQGPEFQNNHYNPVPQSPKRVRKLQKDTI
eukprot:6460187-Amphidinium_carterae.1